MKVRIKQKIDRYDSLRYVVQYRKWFFWRTVIDYISLSTAIIYANKLQTWDKTYYDWQNLSENEEEKK